MAKLIETLMDDIKTAMKAREMDTVTTLRSVHAKIKDVGTNAGKEETDELVIDVMTKAVKQRLDSVEQFRSGGRDDLADNEQREIDLLKKYLPEQLGEDEIRALVTQAIADTGAAGKQGMGKVMGALMPKVKGRADGKLVNRLVQELLG